MGRKKAPEDVRATAILAATRLFADRSADAVSLQEVAREVGVTKQALLYHFGTKDALVDAVANRLLELANRELVDLMGAMSHDGDERMAQALLHLRAMFEAEPAAARVVLRFLLDGGSAAAARLLEGARPWLRFMVDLIERGQREGTMRPELDPEAAVAQIGLLLLTNVALLPVHGWTESAPDVWQQRRLAELVRAVHAILFVS